MREGPQPMKLHHLPSYQFHSLHRLYELECAILHSKALKSSLLFASVMSSSRIVAASVPFASSCISYVLKS